MENKDMASLVRAIRAHDRVGEGTCTSIDECWSDAEIIEHLEMMDISTEQAAIEWAIETEGLFLEQGLNQRPGDDDDWQLLAWQEWNKAQ